MDHKETNDIAFNDREPTIFTLNTALAGKLRFHDFFVKKYFTIIISRSKDGCNTAGITKVNYITMLSSAIMTLFLSKMIT